MQSSVRWVVLRITERPLPGGGDQTLKISTYLGEVIAPDKALALQAAFDTYGGAGLSVVSRISWDMSREEHHRLSGRKQAKMASLVKNSRIKREGAA